MNSDGSIVSYEGARGIGIAVGLYGTVRYKVLYIEWTQLQIGWTQRIRMYDLISVCWKAARCILRNEMSCS